MQFKDLVLKTRSYRRFDECHHISEKELLGFIENARCAGSGANMQPLKYIVSCSTDTNKKMFEATGWAGYLKDWPGPKSGERPSAYIVILIDGRIQSGADMDVGIAAQTIMLAASEKGLGGCMIGSVQKEKLRKHLEIPENLDISLVLALGKPVEKIVLEDLAENRSIEYYRSADGTHHVPKRPMDELVFKVCHFDGEKL